MQEILTILGRIVCMTIFTLNSHYFKCSLLETSNAFCLFCSPWRQYMAFTLNMVLDWEQIFEEIKVRI